MGSLRLNGTKVGGNVPQLVAICFSGVVACVPGSVLAQDKGDAPKVLEIGKWYPAAEAGLALTQSAYSDNWAGGDKGSVVWAAIFSGAAENQIRPKVNWNSTLKLAYGQTHQQSVGSDGKRHWDRPEKSTDLVNLETIFRFTLGSWVDPYASGTFETFFQDATDTYGRNLSFNPRKFKESAGIARQLIDEENRSLLSRVGLSLRQSSRRYFPSPPSEGNETESESAHDVGVEWITDYRTNVLNDRVTWTSKLIVYKPFSYSGNDKFDAFVGNWENTGISPDVKDFTTVTDIDWENIFSTQITKLLSVNLYTRWVYDKYDNSVQPVLGLMNESIKNADAVRTAIRKAGQFKYTLSLGLIYRFI